MKTEREVYAEACDIKCAIDRMNRANLIPEDIRQDVINVLKRYQDEKERELARARAFCIMSYCRDGFRLAEYPERRCEVHMNAGVNNYVIDMLDIKQLFPKDTPVEVVRKYCMGLLLEGVGRYVRETIVEHSSRYNRIDMRLVVGRIYRNEITERRER
jgi:hypothetical protein